MTAEGGSFPPRPTHCARCGGVLGTPSDDGARCAGCGTPHVHHDLSPDKFPLTIKILSGKTGEILWMREVTLAKARMLAEVVIPGYANTDHYPVRVEIAYADGTTEIRGMT